MWEHGNIRAQTQSENDFYHISEFNQILKNYNELSNRFVCFEISCEYPAIP